MSFIHISNINNSVMSFGGEVNVSYSSDSRVITELPLQALEMNRKLVEAISKEWETEEQCIEHVTLLIQETKKLELDATLNLKSHLP